jgi:hypothetical protein
MSELSDMIHALKPVSTATIATVLFNRGLRRIWMRGTQPIRPGQPRAVGRALPYVSFLRARIWLRLPRGHLRARRERRSRRCLPAESRWLTLSALQTPEYLAIFCVHGLSTAEWVVSARHRWCSARHRGRSQHRTPCLTSRRRRSSVGDRSHFR